MERPASVPFESDGLSRRQFLRGASALVVSLVTANAQAARPRRRHANHGYHTSSPTRPRQESVANGWAKNFPDVDAKKTGIEHIRSRIHEKAQHAFCFIRQIHYSWMHGEENQDWAPIEECQADVLKAIKWLIKNEHTKLKSIFAEGMYNTETAEEFLNRWDVPRIQTMPDRRYTARWGADLVLHQVDGIQLYGPEKEDISKRLSRAKLREKELLELIAGNGRQAVQTASLDRMGSEATQENNRRSELNEVSALVEQLTFKPREDHFLEVASKAHSPIQYILYGGAHDWTDNVIEWNKVHPHQAFSFVELTPKAYVDWNENNYAQASINSHVPRFI